MSQYMSIVAVIVLFFFLQENSAQDITISGKVTDSKGAALEGALVKLEKAGFSSTTDAGGLFKLEQIGTSILFNNSTVPNDFSATIHKNFIRINILKKSDVSVTAYSLQGKIISKANHQLDAGTHNLKFTPGNSGVYSYKVKCGESEVTFKAFEIGGSTEGMSIQGQSVAGSPVRLAKGAAFSDVLMVTKSGFKAVSMPITEATKSDIVIKMDEEGSSEPGAGLIAHWKFDEPGESDVCKDASGNGYDGTPKGPIKRGTGKVGPHCLSMAGAQTVLLPHTMPIPTAPMSISCWVKINTFEGRKYILTFMPNTTEDHHEYEYVWFVESDVVKMWMWGHVAKGANKEKWGVWDLKKAVVNEWMHLAVTLGPPEGGTPLVATTKEGAVNMTWVLYRNGEPVNTVINPFPPFQKNAEYCIGSKPHGEYFMNGDIDDLMLFNKQLTAEEVKSIYEANK